MRILVLSIVVAAPLAFGCVAQQGDGEARIEFHAEDTLGITCDSALSTWSVTNRETMENGTALCDQPVLFVSLTPNATYTFDIQGRVGQDLCFRGSCEVTAEEGKTTVAKCGRAVTNLCDGNDDRDLQHATPKAVFDGRAQTE